VANIAIPLAFCCPNHMAQEAGRQEAELAGGDEKPQPESA
jgi:hypothetical protein